MLNYTKGGNMLKNKYRSLDEELFAEMLINYGITRFEYEPKTYTLIEGKKTAYSNYKDTTYTPDFEFKYGGRHIVVEVKGYQRGDNGLKNKMASLYFEERGIEYYVVRLQGRIKDGTKNFYFYNDNTNKHKTRQTFWERTNINAI